MTHWLWLMTNFWWLMCHDSSTSLIFNSFVVKTSDFVKIAVLKLHLRRLTHICVGVMTIIRLQSDQAFERGMKQVIWLYDSWVMTRFLKIWFLRGWSLRVGFCRFRVIATCRIRCWFRKNYSKFFSSSWFITSHNTCMLIFRKMKISGVKGQIQGIFGFPALLG